MVMMLCETSCTGNPFVNGEKTRKAYRRGELYDIDPNAPWAIHFRGVSPEEATMFASQVNGVREPDYFKPVAREAQDDLFEKFRVG